MQMEEEKGIFTLKHTSQSELIHVRHAQLCQVEMRIPYSESEQNRFIIK